VRLADGPGGTRIVCVSTPMATGGVHQYARLAAPFRGVRPVAAVPLTGFGAGEPLPATAGAAVEAVAAAALEAAGGEPFVLLGYSSGGTLAYATALHLRDDPRIRGVVMLDTFAVHGGAADAIPFNGLALGMFQRSSSFGGFDVARWSAMGGWAEVVPHLAVDDTDLPVLFVQCTEPFPSPGSDQRWLTRPLHPGHDLRPVPANHFTMIEEEADQTAALIEAWLTERAS